MRLSTPNRALAAAISIAYLLGYLLVFAHFVEERHVECAEHGTEQHVESSTSDSPLRQGLSSLPTADDDHCTLLRLVRPTLSANHAEQVSNLAPLDEFLERSPALRDRAITNTAVLRYAPKQSPPTTPDV